VFFELFVGMQWMNRQRMCVRRIPLFMLVSIIDFKFSLQQENKAGKNRKRRPKVSLIPRLTTEEKPISSVMDPGRSPCPYRLVDDTGGAFMIGRAVVVAILILGAIGGAIWHMFRGFRNSPKGSHIQGMVYAVKTRAPVLGGRWIVQLNLRM